MTIRRVEPTLANLRGRRQTMMYIECAMLPCKCGVGVGVLIGTDGEPATGAWSCAPEHDQLIAHFNLLLKESLVEPQKRPLVDVVDELLGQAARFYDVPLD